MCGIVGYVGPREAAGFLVAGLRRLEYRGYDSSGMAAVTPDGQFAVVKTAGRIERLEELLGGVSEEYSTLRYRQGMFYDLKPIEVNRLKAIDQLRRFEPADPEARALPPRPGSSRGAGNGGHPGGRGRRPPGLPAATGGRRA